jgi:hypothetical protein
MLGEILVVHVRREVFGLGRICVTPKQMLLSLNLQYIKHLSVVALLQVFLHYGKAFSLLGPGLPHGSSRFG